MTYESDPEIEQDIDDGPDGDEIIQCWCGVRGTFDELFDDAVYELDCGGTGTLECYCGGDQCVCHHHGQEIECPGCQDCGYESRDDDGCDDDMDWGD